MGPISDSNQQWPRETSASSNYGNFRDMTAHQDSTTPATKPCQTGILHKTLSKGLSPKSCQAKTQLHQLPFYKMRTPSAPIVSIFDANSSWLGASAPEKLRS